MVYVPLAGAPVVVVPVRMSRKRRTTASVPPLTRGKEGKVATTTDMSMHMVDTKSVMDTDPSPGANASTVLSTSKSRGKTKTNNKNGGKDQAENRAENQRLTEASMVTTDDADARKAAPAARSRPYITPKSGMTTLHRCRFVDWTPEAINAMSMAPVGCRPVLALVRANGDLELRDASQNWCPLHIPTGGTIGRSIEAVLWGAGGAEDAVDGSMEEEQQEEEEEDEDRDEKGKKTVKAPTTDASPLLPSGMMGCQTTADTRQPMAPMARLFTAGHDGMLVEWDPLRLIPRQHLELDAGGLWALAGGEGQHLAVACENGTIKVVKFSPSTGRHWGGEGPGSGSGSGSGLSLVKTIPIVLAEDDQEERILSLAWAPAPLSRSRSSDPLGRLLAAGTSTGSLIIISWSTGQVLHRIRVGSMAIWSLQFINDHLLVMGSAQGMVRLWDCALGVLLSSHGTGHKHADVLSLAVSPDRTRIFASSSDGRTLVLGLAGDHKWVKLETLSMHRHDVRSSLCVSLPGKQRRQQPPQQQQQQPMFLLTAGISGEVAIKGEGEKDRTKYLGMISRPPIKMAPLGRLLVAASHPGRLDFWTLGQIASSATPAASTMTLEQLRTPGRFLLQMNIPHGESVSSFDLSADGRIFGYCTRSTLRLYRLSVTGGPLPGREAADGIALEGEEVLPSHVQLSKIKIILPAPLGGHYCSLQALALSPDGSSLAVASMSPKGGALLCLFNLTKGNSAELVASHHFAMPMDSSQSPSTASPSPSPASPAAIDFLRFSEDGSKLVLIDIMGSVHLFSVSTPVTGLQLMSSDWLPSRVTAARFVPGTGDLLLVTADRRLSLVVLREGKGGGPSSSSSILSPPRWPHPWLYHHSDIITGIAFAPTVEGSTDDAINRVRLLSENALVECSLGDLLAEGIDLTKKDGNSSGPSRTRRRRRSTTAKVTTMRGDLGTPYMRLHTEYGKILFFDYLSPPYPGSGGVHREAVLVERPLEHIHLSLPPAQDRKQFGGF